MWRRDFATGFFSENTAELILLALYFSQMSMVAIWMGLGNTPATMRIAAGFPILIALGDPKTLLAVVLYRPLIDFTAQVAGLWRFHCWQPNSSAFGWPTYVPLPHRRRHLPVVGDGSSRFASSSG